MPTELDPLIHAPARLRIVVALAALRPGDTFTFARLRDLLELTPGNLITHLRRLEDGGYTESAEGRRPGTTEYWLTEEGRVALARYRKALSEILGD